MQAQMKNIKEKSTAICHIASIFDAEIFYLRQILRQDLIGEQYFPYFSGGCAECDNFCTFSFYFSTCPHKMLQKQAVISA